MKRDPSYVLDPVEKVADAIASEEMASLRPVLPTDLATALEEILAVSLAHHPELRGATRRLAPDPNVASSGDVAREERNDDGRKAASGGGTT